MQQGRLQERRLRPLEADPKPKSLLVSPPLQRKELYYAPNRRHAAFDPLRLACPVSVAPFRHI